MAFEEFSGPEAIDDYICDEIHRASRAEIGLESRRKSSADSFSEVEPYTENELEFVRHVIKDYNYNTDLTKSDKKICPKRVVRWVDEILHGDIGWFLSKKEQLDMTHQTIDYEGIVWSYDHTYAYSLIDKRKPPIPPEEIPF